MKLLCVAVPTLDRWEILLRTLQDLAGQDSLPDEVIVVDQAAGSIERSGLAVGIPGLKHIQCGLVGLPAARNLAIENCSCEYILFIDDDVQLPVGFVSAYRDAIHEYGPNAQGLGGPVVEEPDELSNWEGIGGRVTKYGRALRNFREGTCGTVDALPGGNMAFRASLIRSLGGFDERFRRAALLEETDMCYRIRENGGALILDARLALKHLRAPSGGCRSLDLHSTMVDRIESTILFASKHESVSEVLSRLALCVAVLRKSRELGRGPTWDCLASALTYQPGER